MTTVKIPEGPNWLPVYLYLLVFFMYAAFKCAAFSIKHTKNLYGINDFVFILMDCSLVLT